MIKSFLGRQPSKSPPGKLDRTDLEKVARQAVIAAAGAAIVVLIGYLQQEDMKGGWWVAGAITILEGLRRWLTGNKLENRSEQNNS